MLTMRWSGQIGVVVMGSLLAFFGCGGDTVEESAVGLEFATAPPAEVVAGEDFVVETVLIDDTGESVAREGVEVEVGLDEHEFRGADREVLAETDGDGVAEFGLAVEAAGDGIVLTAAIVGQEGTIEETFDVVAGDADEQLTSIEGENGVADGETEAKITIELFDSYENPLLGEVPEFSASGEGNEYSDCSEVDSSGVATCGMTSNRSGEKVLEITEPVSVIGDTIHFDHADCEETGTPFGGGEGTSDEPHRLCSPSHLMALSEDASRLDDAYLLVTDIDMEESSGFEPIGNDDTPFSGSFDGDGYSIRNLAIHREDEDKVGMFGNIGEEGVIKDVNLENVEVFGRDNVGGLAGENRGEIYRTDTTGVVAGNEFHVGGLAGINMGTITDASSSSELKNPGSSTGGLVGRNNGGSRSGSQGTISSSSTSGEINVEGGLAGGLVGFNDGIVIDVESSSDVHADGNAVGGLVANNSGEIKDSSSSGNVSSPGYYVGGLVGSNSGDIERSGAFGDVDGLFREEVGGLVGRNYEPGVITSSYAAGAVTGEDYAVGGGIGRNQGVSSDSYATGSVTGQNDYIGGFVGMNTGQISRGYATGVVDGVGDEIGGFVGRDNSGDAISGAYWDGDTSGVETSAAGDMLTTEEFSEDSNFEDWDFTNTWVIGTADDGEERPLLQWQQ